MPNYPFRVIVRDLQSDITSLGLVLWCIQFQIAEEGIVIMAHDGLFGLTSGSPSYTKTELTATLGQLTLFDGSPVRVSVQACMQGLCVYVCVRCMCICVSPWRASMAGWCIRWHVNYSAFKRGLSWVEVSGGLMAVWWSERLPVGKRRGDEGHMWRAKCIPADHADSQQPLTQVSDQIRLIIK